jgi:hypothetical protein
MALAGVAMLLLAACSNIDCPVQNTVSTVYNLYTTDEQVDTLRDTLYVLTRRANGSDTLLLNAAIGVTHFQLPISYTNPEDTLFFLCVNRPDFMALDTVFLKKENIPHFESVDCSASFFHRLTNVRSTNNAIEYIKITKDFVDYDDKTAHFHIGFKARP